MRNTIEHPYESLFGALPKGTLFYVVFQYPNEEEKDLHKRGTAELKDLIETVKTYGGKIVRITSYYGGKEKDVTAKYTK